MHDRPQHRQHEAYVAIDALRSQPGDRVEVRGLAEQRLAVRADAGAILRARRRLQVLRAAGHTDLDRVLRRNGRLELAVVASLRYATSREHEHQSCRSDLPHDVASFGRSRRASARPAPNARNCSFCTWDFTAVSEKPTP